MNDNQDFQKLDNQFDWIIVDHLQTLKAYNAYFKQQGPSNGDSAAYNKIVEIAEEIDSVIIPILDPLKVRMWSILTETLCQFTNRECKDDYTLQSDWSTVIFL